MSRTRNSDWLEVEAPISLFLDLNEEIGCFRFVHIPSQQLLDMTREIIRCPHPLVLPKEVREAIDVISGVNDFPCKIEISYILSKTVH